MSGGRFNRGHMADQRPISGVIIPGQAGSAGREKVKVDFSCKLDLSLKFTK